MFAYHDAGFTTWDLADHYGPAEDFIGAFRRRFAAERGDARAGGDPGLHEVGAAAGPHDPARGRGGDRRFAAAHGHRPARPAAVPLVGLRRQPAISTRSRHLADLRDEGRIRHLALTNFDTARLGGHRRARHPHRLEPGAVFARRPPARGADGGLLPRARRHAARLRHAARRAAVGAVPGPPGAGPRTSCTPPSCRNTSR